MATLVTPQDLQPITALVHRRCGDAKAAVRRGGLQLLEALLVMRASWQGYPRQLPSAADLALLAAATLDPLVRVCNACSRCACACVCSARLPGASPQTVSRELMQAHQHAVGMPPLPPRPTRTRLHSHTRAQVSVRKAALVALSTLLELFPAEPQLCQAWVASALPLVRDVEASIQVKGALGVPRTGGVRGWAG
jgi:hypothetical protein